MNKIFLIILSLFVGINAFAQIDSHCEQLTTSITSSGSNYTYSAPLVVNINPPLGLFNTTTPIGGKVGFKVKSAKAYIKVDFGENYAWGDEQFTVNMNLGLTASYTSVNPPVVVNPITIPSNFSSIVLNNRNPEQVIVLDLLQNAGAFVPNQTNLFFVYQASEKMYKVSVQPNFVVQPPLVNITATDVASRLRVRVCYEVEYGVDAAAVTTPAKLPVTQTPVQIGNTKRYNFSWANSENILYPAYEIQILRLFNRHTHTPTSLEDIEAVIDWSKALSFVIPEHTIQKAGNIYSKELTVSEFTGYYVWRVRPIGSIAEGGVANNNNWGAWDNRSATNLMNGTLVDLNQMSDIGGTSLVGSIFFFTDPDENEERNTIYSRVFTEDGKTHEGMNYADGLLKSRQSQSYFPSNPEHQTVITQQYYDHVGRGAISTLPVPTQNQLSGYQERFGRNAVTGDLYTVEDFDAGSKEAAPNPLSLKGAGSNTDYYSNDGPDPYVDNAQGFPFSLSRYSNDGLDNVEQQSGVGKKHMIGTAADMGRTTRKNYTSDVSADELIRIFGMEAPDHNSVTKEITTDPNGTESVSYIDKNGKLLATCLSVNSGLNTALQDLGSTANATMPVIDIMRAAELTSEGYVSTKRLLLTESGALHIDYTPDGCDGFTICDQTLYCDFELTLFVANIEAPTINLISQSSTTTNHPSNTVTNPILSSNLCTHNFSSATPYTITLPALPAGDYIIKKVLKAVDNGSQGTNGTVQAFIDAKLARTEATLYLYNDLVTNILANLDEDNLDDFDDAMLCVSNFITAAQTSSNISALIPSLESCFQALNFDMSAFDFDRFTEPLIDLSIVTNCSLDIPADPDQVPQIAISFDDCGGGTNLTIDANIDVMIPPCDGPAGGPYVYKGVPYLLPPFLEYFADATWANLTQVVKDRLTTVDETQDPDVLVEPSPAILDATLNVFVNNIFPGYGITASQISDYINNATSINDNKLNKMIWHMVNDKYYCGQVKWEDGSDATYPAGYYKLVESNGTVTLQPLNTDPMSPSTDLTTQYECKDIWSCWVANVASISALISQEQDAVPDPFASISQNEGAQGEDGQSLDEHFESNIPWLLSLFLGDDPFQAFQDDNDFAITAGDINFDNLPDLFLDCTGYRYARIIDPRIVSPIADFGTTNMDHHDEYVDYLSSLNHPHQFGSGASGNSPTINFNTLDMPLWGAYTGSIPSVISADMNGNGNTSEIEEYFKNRSASPIDLDKFPFTHNPVFAFKYYEYYDPSSTTSSTFLAFEAYNRRITDLNNADADLTNNQPLIDESDFLGDGFDAPAHYRTVEIEMEYPYPDPTTQPNPPFCSQPATSTNTGHDEWTCGRRDEFLKAIMNRQELTINPENFPDPANFFAADPLVIASAQDCDDARAPYLMIDPTTGNLVPDLYDNPVGNSCASVCESRRTDFKTAIIAALTKRCYVIGGCTNCPGHISLEHVDVLTQQLVDNCKTQCAVLTDQTPQMSCTLPDGTVISYCDVIYGTPCQQYLMEQVRTWAAEVDFPSVCPDEATFPAGHLDGVFNTQTPNQCEDPNSSFTTPLQTSPTSQVKKIENP